MKLPIRTLLFCTLISLAACESGDAPERELSTPATTVAPAGKPAAAAEDDPPAIKAIKALPEGERQQAYMQELQNSSPEIRAAAAKEIKPVGDAVNRLADMIVNDPSPEVRIATTWSLELADEPERQQALDALVKCLADMDLNVVAECIRSLAFLDDESSVVHLQPLLTHQDEKVRNEASEAIKWIQ